MNLLMKIDRWIGILLLVVGILSFFLHWFSEQGSIIYIGIGIMLVALSATVDKNKHTKK